MYYNDDDIYYTYVMCFVKDKDKKYYVGISKNLNKRLLKHLSDLVENKHHNKLLQNIYNKGYRYDDNKVIYEYDNRSDSIEKEHELINKYRKLKKCLNLNTIPTGYKEEDIDNFTF